MISDVTGRGHSGMQLDGGVANSPTNRPKKAALHALDDEPLLAWL